MQLSRMYQLRVWEASTEIDVHANGWFTPLPNTPISVHAGLFISIGHAVLAAAVHLRRHDKCRHCKLYTYQYAVVSGHLERALSHCHRYDRPLQLTGYRHHCLCRWQQTGDDQIHGADPICHIVPFHNRNIPTQTQSHNV